MHYIARKQCFKSKSFEMWLNCWMLTALAVSLLVVVEGSWGTPGDGQYHIQTDEGPERYFRFQTDNGQFRKERRLQDGTVVGTEAWIDAAGFLRQKDYIADKDGYRILKSKTVFVGYNRAIDDAIKSTKSMPAQNGVLVNGRNGLRGQTSSVNIVDTPKQVAVADTTTTTPLPPIISEPIVRHDPASEAYDGKLNYLSPAEAANIQPQGKLGFDHYPDEVPRLLQRQRERIQKPIVTPYDTPASNSLTDLQQEVAQGLREGSISGTLPLPALDMQPPLLGRGATRQRLRPIAVYDTTPAPIAAVDAAGYSTPSPSPFAAATSGESAPNTNGYYYQRSSTPATHTNAATTNALEINQLDDGLLPPLPPTTHRRQRPPAANSLSGPAVPYDGVGVTANGFRYFLPHQYHEEEQFANEKRAGSFGYVDPFGIRRVVYYNASPGSGFVHRNNNRYVGLGAAPYDAVV
uniref:Cuticle protein 6 n=1 Tax=Bactrocera latifrons TaxID=174628 RepID=A0A0K8V627_BACLA